MISNFVNDGLTLHHFVVHVYVCLKQLYTVNLEQTDFINKAKLQFQRCP